MIKRLLLIAVFSLVLCQSSAFAVETEGEVVFRDSLYGAAIGALLGSAVYLADQDDFAEKLSAGLIIGTVGGLVYGLMETRSFVEIKKDEIRVAIPTPVIEKKDSSLEYSAYLLKKTF